MVSILTLICFNLSRRGESHVDVSPTGPKSSRSSTTARSAAPSALTNGLTGTFLPAPPPPPPPPGIQHLYVGNNSQSGGISQFDLPLTSSSTPNFTILSVNGIISVATDSQGNLAAGTLGSQIYYFTKPLSGASTPSASFKTGGLGAYQLAFVPSGGGFPPPPDQLWSADTSEADLFAPPLGNDTIPAQTVVTGSFGTLGLALDSSLNLYLVNATSGSNIFVYAPPYNNPPTVTTPVIPNVLYRKLAISGNQLFVAVAGPGLGRLDVYNLPLTNSSAPAFSIAGSVANGLNLPEAPAFDQFGNLYVGNLGNATVTVYAPPFSAASLPITTLTIPNYAIFSLAIDPPNSNVPPALSINDVAVTEVNGATVSATFTVTLSPASTLPITVDYSTSDGTANAPADYQSVSGTLSFPPGVTSRTITVPVNGDFIAEADESHFSETFFVNLTNPFNAAILKAQGVGTINDGDAASIFQFASSTASVNENAGSVSLSVTRTGDVSAAGSVHFETSDGTATQKNRYTFEAGTLQWAPGDASSKTIRIPIVNEALVDGNQTFLVRLSNPSGTSAIGNPDTVTVTIIDDDSAPPSTNPIDDANFFVRQHYLDFLGREPDASGLSFWTGQITACGANAACVSNARVNVSAAFFLSIEFQETGGNVLRTQRVAFSRQSGDPNTRVPYLQFMRDARQIGQGVVVGQTGFDTLLDGNKQAYALQIVNDPAFLTRFPIQPAGPYVDSLYASAAVIPTAAERTTAINAFGAGGTLGRVAALRSVADSNSVRQAEFMPSFVLAEYYGYLRRNPTDAPDFSDAGYQFWLAKLIAFNGDFVQAQMVQAFITSPEFRRRFGP